MERILHFKHNIQNGLHKTKNGRFRRFSRDHLVNKSVTEEVQQEINFKELLGEIMDNVKYLNGRNHSVEINVNIRNEVPLVSYKERMEMVLYKLISNSIRNLDPGTLKPFVYIKIHSHAAGTSIMIRDNCKAVKKGVAEEIFGIFDKGPQQYKAFALELYIVKETVEKLNGWIGLASELEEETEFNIHLPHLWN